MALNFKTTKIRTDNSATRKAEARANERVFNAMKKQEYSGDFVYASPMKNRKGYYSGMVKAKINWNKNRAKYGVK